jgi:hypothetical protein
MAERPRQAAAVSAATAGTASIAATIAATLADRCDVPLVTRAVIRASRHFGALPMTI